jgi:XTP/dITP diphosphohydrolase
VRFMLASGNAHKLKEFRSILRPLEVIPMPSGLELPPEGTESFAVNALGKAAALAESVIRDPALLAAVPGDVDRRDDILFIADDSGLEVEALGWAPGVMSARYAGVDGPGADQANVARLLRELAGFAGPAARRARFVCSAVAVAPDMTDYTATGFWWGAIDVAPRGKGGFGYDPVFIPQGSDLTVAQWPQELKDQASHRALAGRALLERLRGEGLPYGDQ